METQVPGDLIRRPLLPQQGQHRLPQLGSASEEALLRAPGAVKRTFLRSYRPVDVTSTVLVHFTADRRHRTPQEAGDGPVGLAGAQSARDLLPLAHGQAPSPRLERRWSDPSVVLEDGEHGTGRLADLP
jgi:hypothetical protein